MQEQKKEKNDIPSVNHFSPLYRDFSRKEKKILANKIAENWTYDRREHDLINFSVKNLSPSFERKSPRRGKKKEFRGWKQLTALDTPQKKR